MIAPSRLFLMHAIVFLYVCIERLHPHVVMDPPRHRLVVSLVDQKQDTILVLRLWSKMAVVAPKDHHPAPVGLGKGFVWKFLARMESAYHRVYAFFTRGRQLWLEHEIIVTCFSGDPLTDECPE